MPKNGKSALHVPEELESLEEGPTATKSELRDEEESEQNSIEEETVRHTRRCDQCS
eukprot:CAMPEP_0177605408 /NCGR_PEP_ID=MMETSP0419_2-20121207/16683_1 /TAXON_ID=582737 /ORGANISM="Tetraselmis sp., Strain GSL018" /LENGTH=55 /DNA_ID=CAMNT_0019099551 /DNA_START=40 /DNA_END=207 /DNA_ORIENTATION=-